MYSNIKICLLLIGCSLLVSTANCISLPPHDKQSTSDKENVDFIQVHESLRPLKCHGVNQTQTLAPESQVVGVNFFQNDVQLHMPPLTVLLKDKTKQSQEFEIEQPKPITESTTSSDLSSSTSTSVSSTLITTSQQQTSEISSTTTGPGADIVITIDPLTTTITTNSSDEQPPVASLTTRKGAAVHCGEANPNGKSNKKLVLDRIVGGRKTEPGEFPFQVRLNIRSRRGSGICGGVILNERYILTAAHCMTACVSQYLTTATIETTGVHATIGDHSIKSNDGEVEIDIEKIIPHERYDACNFYANDHDIALIKTATPIEYRFTSDGYGSINRPCMPLGKELIYKEGESVIVSGWGVTRENSGSLSNILRYVQVPIVNISKCQETYGNRVTNDHVCAGYQSGGRDSCQGDSGGPLVRVVENKYELVGIVSFGYGCGQPSAPGVYTRVASYVDWIQSNI